MAVFAFADGHVKVMAKTQAEQTADTEEGMPLSGVEARSPTNVFLLWNNAGR
jgi:prepilin-type processing-associated H-X9-DG protein